jgi:dTDP-4-dehydrorhamnose 3,5-epimerase
MRLVATAIPGCLRIVPEVHEDERGNLTKTFAASQLAAVGVDVPFREQFHSRSRRGVLRGLHVQLPPYDGAKLVVCALGEVFDVLVDLRRGSPVFGLPVSCVMKAPGDAVLVPAGVAHGFCAISEECLVCYSTTSEYVADADAGVRWDSVGAQWPEQEPLVSVRDGRLPRLDEFVSPFLYGSPGAAS